MAELTESQKRFIQNIAFYVCEYAPLYDIEVNSPIIAQAILESAFGTSKLAGYNNFFGLKTRTKWTGGVYNQETNEEYEPGTVTTINANFRTYPNMADGVLGYFVFLFEPEAYGRYNNVKFITDPVEYIGTLKADGYATDSKYEQKIIDIIYKYDLRQYDTVKPGGNRVNIIRKIVAPGHGKFTAPNPIYFAVHSTANPGATAANHVTYWSNNPDYAVHFVSDWDTAYQCVELDRKCWQVGNGNYTCIGLEICEPKGNDPDKFMRGLEIARSVILQTLDRYGWTVDGAVRSHKWFTENFGGSDHTDPIPYFKRYGWTWQMFLDYLKEGEEELTPDQIKELCNALWSWDNHGYQVEQTYMEVTRTDDPTGRGKLGTTHVRVNQLAPVMQEINGRLADNNKLLSELIALIKDQGR